LFYFSYWWWLALELLTAAFVPMGSDNTGTGRMMEWW
jgi:hypothetical protein